MTKSEGIYFSFMIAAIIAFVALMNFMSPEIDSVPAKPRVFIESEGKVIRKYEIVSQGYSTAMVDVQIPDQETIKTYTNSGATSPSTILGKSDPIQIQANLKEGNTYIFFLEASKGNLPNIIKVIQKKE